MSLGEILLYLISILGSIGIYRAGSRSWKQLVRFHAEIVVLLFMVVTSVATTVSVLVSPRLVVSVECIHAIIVEGVVIGLVIWVQHRFPTPQEHSA